MTPTKQRWLVIGLIMIGLALVGFFGMRVFHAFRRFEGHRPPHFPPPGAGPRETDVSLIRDWMTIGFLSHSYHTPPDQLYRALNIQPNGNEHKSLKQLNDEYFPTKADFVLETVKAVILANQPPTPAAGAATTPTP